MLLVLECVGARKFVRIQEEQWMQTSFGRVCDKKKLWTEKEGPKTEDVGKVELLNYEGSKTGEVGKM